MATEQRSKPNEIRIERVYDAPRSAVWAAWNEPDQAAQWWGPRGFTITTHSKDLRPGGMWHYTMHGPDGTDYVNKTLYHEVELGAKLVYDHGGNDEQAPLFRVTALFLDEGAKTRLIMTMAFPSPQIAIEMGRFIKQVGGNSTWDRLGEYLDKEVAGRDVFIINRSLAAPVARVFEMWTSPVHVSRWLPPVGFTMEFMHADIRSGGSTFYRMSNGADVTMYGRMHYEEVRSPDRLVYTQQFCDEHKNLTRHPLSPVFPATMLTHVTLSAEGPEQTRVSVRWETYGETTPAELAAFLSARAGMTQGWTGSFDKLETLLAGG